MNELLSSKPGWLLRKGIGLVFGLILLLLGLLHFIQYPEILTADLSLTSIHPPAKLVARTTGRISEVLVKNGDLLSPHQLIAVIDNTADYKDVLFLQNFLDSISIGWTLSDTLVGINIRDTLNMGELTPAYVLFLETLKEIRQYRTIASCQKQIRLLMNDLNQYSILLEKQKRQVDIAAKQLALTHKDNERDKSLFAGEVISERELEVKDKEYLSSQGNYESATILVSNTFIQMNSIEKEILQLQIQDERAWEEYKRKAINALKSLKIEMEQWKQSYLIESPIEGRISFFDTWAVYQQVVQGQELFTVVSKQRQELIGKCSLPVTNAGKLEQGQKVNIKLDNYPYEEYGQLEGILARISEVPGKGGYSVDVLLTNGLVTSYHRNITYHEEMKGQAEIITKKLSILDRLFFNLRAINARR